MELQWEAKMMMIATEELLLYSGMDEGERHKRDVGLILLKDAAQSLLEWKPVPGGMSSARFNSRW